MLHSNVVVGDNHYIQQWSVADSTARLALTLAAGDVGKVCFQQDTKHFYLLQATTPTWFDLTGGGTGTVTHTAGALTANQLVIGNGTDDLKTLGSLGTTSQVLHGNAGGAPSFGAVALGTEVSGTLPVANGGTGQTSYTDGQLLIGNTSGNTLTKATLTAGSNITITNGGGSITISSTGGGGGNGAGANIYLQQFFQGF